MGVKITLYTWNWLLTWFLLIRTKSKMGKVYADRWQLKWTEKLTWIIGSSKLKSPKKRSKAYFLIQLLPLSKPSFGLQWQNLTENLSIISDRYSPLLFGAEMLQNNFRRALGKNWFWKFCNWSSWSNTSLLEKKNHGLIHYHMHICM